MLCQTAGNCNPLLQTLLDDELSQLTDMPERRSSYLFRSRRFDPKRSSTYLWRTRKAILEPRDTRGEYLFRTRKMDRNVRGNYLFRTRKSDNPLMDRMLRSSKSYLFRTR